MKKVTDIVWELAEPVVKENGCCLLYTSDAADDN